MEGEQPYLGDLLAMMAIDHLLTGMIFYKVLFSESAWLPWLSYPQTIGSFSTPDDRRHQRSLKPLRPPLKRLAVGGHIIVLAVGTETNEVFCSDWVGFAVVFFCVSFCVSFFFGGVRETWDILLYYFIFFCVCLFWKKGTCLWRMGVFEWLMGVDGRSWRWRVMTCGCSDIYRKMGGAFIL